MSREREEMQSIFHQHIGLQKAILWEEAKGKLRAMVAANGQTQSTYKRNAGPSYTTISQRVERMIETFESDGMHE